MKWSQHTHWISTWAAAGVDVSTILSAETLGFCISFTNDDTISIVDKLECINSEREIVL